MKKLRLIAILALVVLSALTFVACDGNNTELEDWDYITSRNKIIVGYDAGGFPPFGYKEGGAGDLIGFDIEVSKAVATYLGIEVEYRGLDWDMKEQELKTKLVDVVWNGFVITDARLKELNFSIPYITNGTCVVVRADSPYTKISDLAGKKIAYQSGSNVIDYINENATLKDCVKQPVESEVSAVTQDLKNNLVEAVVQGELVAQDTVAKNPEQFKILEERLTLNYVGVGMRKGDNILAFKISMALRALKANGTLDPIAVKYFGSADILLV